MQEVRWLAFRPNQSAWYALGVTAGGIAVTAGVLRMVPPDWQRATVSTIYSAWLGLALLYASRTASLSEVGLTGRRLFPGALAATAVALLGLAGSLRDPSMAGATLFFPGTLRFLAMTVSTLAPAFAEQLVFAGLLQLRFEESFGRLAGILAYGLLFTSFHVAMVWLPGAVPPTGGGMTQFVLGIFVSSCLLALIFSYARNVWAMALAGGTNALLYNLYLLSVRPAEVLVADPAALVSGVPLLLGWMFAIWLVDRMAGVQRVV